jgi:hypothetical protein
MTSDRRDILVENLAVAAAAGVLVLIVAAVSLLSLSGSRAWEASTLEASFSASSAQLVLDVDDPAFERIYALGGISAYGAVLSLNERGSSVLVAALFSPKGELRGTRIIDSFADRLAEDALVSRFAGASEAFGRAAEAVKSAARKGE